MANQEHLDILMQGVKAWNEWRRKYPEIEPDLRHTGNTIGSLSKCNLNGANLSRANLTDAILLSGELVDTNLFGANLRGAVLAGARLQNVNMSCADLSSANFSGASFNNVDLSGANLKDIDLSNAYLSKINLRGLDLTGANLTEACLLGVDLTAAILSKADLRRAELSGTHINDLDYNKLDFMDWEEGIYTQEANLSHANLEGADLRGVNLRRVNLHHANLQNANLSESDLRETDLNGANLRGANLTNASLVKTKLRSANLTGCYIYGISAWDVQLNNTKQSNLVITPLDEPSITVDNLKVAQFIYLLLNNQEIRDVINTITSKAVLILGRFTPERKAVLDDLREALRAQGYLPILFDFEKPGSRNFTETVRTLAHLSRFIIADLTDPSSIPQELQAIAPTLAIPVQPILLEGKREYAMFVDLLSRYSWVLPIHYYIDQAHLLATLKEHIIEPAEQKAQELEKR